MFQTLPGQTRLVRSPSGTFFEDETNQRGDNLCTHSDESGFLQGTPESW